MIYKGYILKLFLLILALVASLCTGVYCLWKAHYIYATLIGVLTLFLGIKIHRFISFRFRIIDDFFEAVKYRDFSRWFPEDKGSKDITSLYKEFNEVNKTIKEINSKTEAQYIYLQKILEMVDVGIVAFNLETGMVLWSNDSFRSILNFPNFKNIHFVKSRKPELYDAVFDNYNPTPKAISVTANGMTLKVLISDTVFKIDADTFKLVVIQNIDNTLDENESEAWKKLLSVMTHEIMNSIAPISSLAETLQHQIDQAKKNNTTASLNIDDLNAGVATIKKRSDGLLKFAKTYRNLHKVTELNLKKVAVSELFKEIKLLMGPSIKNKGIALEFSVQDSVTAINIDRYLIEQVLINLLLNAMDACKTAKAPRIKVKAALNANKQTIISVIDNGTGVPDEILDKLFIPFFSTKKSGSGIGLSLCKQIMLLHKGKIHLKTEKDKGTAFYLIFKN